MVGFVVRSPPPLNPVPADTDSTLKPGAADEPDVLQNIELAD